MNITFETAKLAKEKGFELDKYLSIDDENPKNLNSNYNPRDYQPWYFDLTQSLLQKWLREVHNIHITVTSISQESWQSHITRKGERLGKSYTEDADTYEEALEQGLLEGLNLIPNEHTQSSN